MNPEYADLISLAAKSVVSASLGILAYNELFYLYFGNWLEKYEITHNRESAHRIARGLSDDFKGLFHFGPRAAINEYLNGE